MCVWGYPGVKGVFCTGIAKEMALLSYKVGYSSIFYIPPFIYILMNEQVGQGHLSTYTQVCLRNNNFHEI